MKRKTTIKSLLLVVAMLVGGTSAWGAEEETTIYPTGGVTTVNTGSSDVAYSSQATTWSINQGGVSNGNIGRYAGPYCLVKFDASGITGDITAATLSFDYASAAYNTSYNIYLLGAADWDATTIIWSNLSDKAKSATTIGSGTWSTKNKTGTINYTITSNVSKSLMGMAICCNTARAQVVSNFRLTITYTTGTVYTATFNETNSLNPTIKIYSDAECTDEVSNGTLDDGTTYYFAAKLIGYEDYKGNFTVSGSNPTVNFTMTAIPAYTINAVSGGSTLSTIASGYAKVDATYSTYLSKFIYVNGVYYELDDASNENLSNYQANYTMGNSGNEVKEINYSLASNIVFFSEWENATQSISNAGYYTTYNSSTMSGGWAKAVQGNANRHLRQSFTITDAGKYLIEMPYYNSNASTRQYALYLDGTEEANKMEAKSVNGSTGGTFSKEVELTSGSHTVYLMENGATLTPQFDYLLVTRASVSKSITSAGYATYCSPYPLDFTGSGLEAYIAVVSNSKFAFQEVTSVPANTGVLLKGDEGDHNITVVASSSTDVSGNKLVGVNTETADVAAGILVLKNGAEGVGFYKTTKAFTVGAHTAYLPAAVAAGRAFIGFDLMDNETTGFDAMLNSKAQNEEVVYNLQGMRVKGSALGKKGLYIVDGKKHVIR